MIRRVRWPRSWTLTGVLDGWSVSWSREHDALHLDKRSAAVLALGELMIARRKYRTQGSATLVDDTEPAMIVAMLADAEAT